MISSFPITIIIPTYNRAKTLLKYLTLYLELPVNKIIIVDDGSTDETEEYFKPLSSSKVKYVKNAINLGLPAARNVGIKAATSEYVLMGEDDVVMEEGYIKKLFDYIIRLKADFVAGRLIKTLPNETIEQALLRSNSENPKEFFSKKSIFADYSCSFEKPVETPWLHACSLYKRELALKYPYYEKYIGNAFREESDFYLNLYKNGKIGYFCSDAVAYHMHHDGTGGARKSKFKYNCYSIYNNRLFFSRNSLAIKSSLNISECLALYELRDLFHCLKQIIQ